MGEDDAQFLAVTFMLTCALIDVIGVAQILCHSFGKCAKRHSLSFPFGDPTYAVPMRIVRCT